MVKSDKFLTRLLRANIRITNIILVAVFLLLIVIYCIISYSQGIRDVADLCEMYSEDVRNKITIATSKSNYMFGNYTIVNGMERDYDESVFSKYDFSGEITMYIDSLGVMGDESTISIYTDNESVYASKYINRIEALENVEVINNKLLASPDNTYWQLEKDFETKKYILTLFRKFPISGTTIVKIDTLIDAKEYDENNITIVHSNDVGKTNDSVEVRSIVNRDFAIVGMMNVHSVLSDMFIGSLLLLMLCILLCYFVFWVVRKTTNSVTGEFVRFIAMLEEQQVEDSLINYEGTQEYELKIIKDTINRMMENMRGAIEEKHKAEKEKEALNLQLLQSKIDPHLLYNSLSYINLIAYKKKDFETVTVVNALVDYYRAVLVRDDLSTMALEEVLLEKYINIVQLSEKTKIKYESCIDDELLGISIPHLSLQPFVENSVLHGFNGKDDFCVQLSIISEKNNIIIKITDNGSGMTEDKVEALNNIAKESNRETHGIENTIKRLRVFFGEETKVNFGSIPDEGTAVDIVLPKRKYDW